jgi:hypothetical protein
VYRQKGTPNAIHRDHAIGEKRKMPGVWGLVPSSHRNTSKVDELKEVPYTGAFTVGLLHEISRRIQGLRSVVTVPPTYECYMHFLLAYSACVCHNSLRWPRKSGVAHWLERPVGRTWYGEVHIEVCLSKPVVLLRRLKMTGKECEMATTACIIRDEFGAVR